MIPGFGLSFGIMIAILSLVVLIPLCSLVIYTAQLSPSDFFRTVTQHGTGHGAVQGAEEIVITVGHKDLIGPGGQVILL